jgi:serine/threonine protein phosphatase 1
MVIFTDPHGCRQTFKALLKKVRRSYPDDPICVAGDAMDRGPDTPGLIQDIIDGGYDYVNGNHDYMMMNYTGKGYNDIWRPNGGDKALKQYGKREKLLLDHQMWLKEQPYIREYPQLVNAQGRYLIVTHSGISHPAIPSLIHGGPTSMDYYRAIDEIIWNRSTPVDLGYAFNVFGHTPTPEPIVTDYYANIDTGCCYWKPEPPLILGPSKRPRLGKLTAFQFPDMKIFQQENVDWEMRPEYNDATL